MPSTDSISGADNKNAMTVIIENRFISSKLSSLSERSFLHKTFRDWLVRFEAMALQNPIQLKETSVTDANTTPPTIGTSEPNTNTEGVSPRNRTERRTEKKGSMALMVWVKETATLPKLTLVKTFPSMWIKARGRIFAYCLGESLGLGCRFSSHMSATKKDPDANWKVVMAVVHLAKD